MHIPEELTPIEYVDPCRDRYGDPEFFDCEHADFCGDSDWQIQHHGHNVAKWNRTFRGGQSRSLDGIPWLRELIDAEILWRNPNLVLVPSENGYTELHAVMASVLPDEVLQKHGVPRPNANFCLWPFNSTWAVEDRPRFARMTERAFSDFIWERLLPSRAKRSALHNDSSVRLLMDDSRRWQAALYRAAMKRAEEMEAPQQPMDFTLGMAQALLIEGDPARGIPPGRIEGGSIVLRNTHGDDVFVDLPPPQATDVYRTINGGKGGLPAQVYPALRGGPLWDFRNKGERDDLLERMLEEVDRDALDQVLALLTREALLEDVGDESSWLGIDVARKFQHSRSNHPQVQVDLREIRDNQVFSDGRGVVGHADVLLRDFMALLDPVSRKMLLLSSWGQTRNEVAEDQGVSRATVSRKLDLIKPRLIAALGGS